MRDLTDPEVCVTIGVSSSTLARLNRAGLGPPRYRIGASCYTRRDDLDAWLRARPAA